MIKSLEEAGPEAGGKALGLQKLNRLGLHIPPTEVLVHPTGEMVDIVSLRESMKRLGEGPFAVRSSAMSEDGDEASFAGQFESFLGVVTPEEVHDAVLKCIGSAGARRILNYAGERAGAADLRISVILQKMVDARVSGVIFSANPVNHRRDLVVVNAVAGLGEQLVSGIRDAHHYELFRSGSNLADEASKNGHLLQEEDLRELLAGTLKAEAYAGHPVDMEWAIGKDGTLYWLQLRPVTTLDPVHVNELDTVNNTADGIWTLGNIGEMMPGVATPLTWSISAEAIDYGMTVLADRAGAFRLKDRHSPRYIQMFYNRLFINMSHMMDYPRRVWLNTPEDVMFALSGKVFPGITATPDRSIFTRVLNFIKQMINTARGEHHLMALRKLEAGFRVETSGDPADLHRRIGEARQELGIGFGHHLGTSAQSGTLYSAFMRIMTNDKRRPEAADHHIATTLLLDIPGIESADAVKSLERFAGVIRADNDFAKLFTASTPAGALLLLKETAPEEIRRHFASFLERHGHRCVRESELREKTWAENPVQLIRTLQMRVKGGELPHRHHDMRREIRKALAGLPLFKRAILMRLIPAARKAVARREITKALSIRMVSRIRTACQELAVMLTQEGLLDDTDQVWFLTYDELGRLISDRDPSWKIKASKRRELMPLLEKMKFPEISFGRPEPMEEEEPVVLSEGQLRGIPVSQGVVEGVVRIINSLEEAERLEEGEIMVASFTDIGWTPYFSIISGLVTEIGSPLSHGAVVAREYGIPAVVAVKGAKRFLADGDRVRLDGNRGIIEVKS